VTALREERWDDAANAAEAVLAGDETHADARSLLRQALRREPAGRAVAELTGTRQVDEAIAQEHGSEGTATGGRAVVDWGRQCVDGLRSRVRSLLHQLRRVRGNAAVE
jgi:hypothetical protein